VQPPEVSDNFTSPLKSSLATTDLPDTRTKVDNDLSEREKGITDLDTDYDSALDEEGPMELATDSSDDDSVEETEEIRKEKQDFKESLTGHSDFDYHEVQIVQPSGQLKNRIKNLIEQTWNILDEEYKSHGELPRYKAKALTEDALQPDVRQVWWTDLRRCAKVKSQPLTKQFYRLWRSYKAPLWAGPLIPESLGKEEQKVAWKEAKSLPECFYLNNSLPVITPDNVDDFVKHLQENNLDLTKLNVCLWSWFSGTGRLAKTMMRRHKDYAVLFPIDLRYGWNIQDSKIQAKLQ